MSTRSANHLNNLADLNSIARSGDLVLYITLLVSLAAALAIGDYFGDLPLALIGSGMVFVFGSAAFFAARGSVLARIVLTTCNVAAVALHIQLGRGTSEFHFGVFVLLGLLLVYRDWRMIVLAAGLFAVHHVAFDRLQALNLGFYCTTEANLLRTLMHAVYVVVQTSIEIYLAVRLHEAAVEGSELAALVRNIDRGGSLCLDAASLEVSAPIAIALKAAIGKMGVAMSEVKIAAESIESASAEIALGNIHLSERTEEQATSLQQTSMSMNELTGSVKNTAQTAEEATELAQSASTAAREGGEAVGRVVATMNAISLASDRIADISAVIDSIAFQTNILALNAAVEAARAGEHGRGFAVVATEVRTLAQRSAGAAKQIKGLLGDSADTVDVGLKMAEEAGGSMDNIVNQARQVSELIGVISSATGHQTAGITQVGAAVSQLDSVTQHNAALVEESAAATQSLKGQAIRLNEVVDRFTLAPT